MDSGKTVKYVSFGWLGVHEMRWGEVIYAQIACIIASLLIVAHELLATGELPANIVERLLTLSAMVLTAAFFTGLVVEWSERRGRGYR